MSTVATRYTKFQVGAAAAALTVATVLTPAAIAPTVAHATPSMTTISENVGAFALAVNPVVAPPTPVDCAAVNFSLGCYAVQGFAAGTQAIVRGAVVYIGTAAYVVAAGTGQLFKVIGSILPGPIGAFFTNVGDGVSAFANTIAITFQVGPYQTAQ